ncbi:MAG: hypothetical protein IJ903_06760 [Ruminococcus sp.]|nr:hypothetical protein [Ruminococcus sp.]
MNTINCSCGNNNSCGCCCKSCQFNPCAVTCGGGCSGTADYAYIYNTAAQTVAADAEVTFSANGPLSGTITHTAGTADIVIGNTGVYLVSVTVNPTTEGQYTVYKNGTAVEGATFVSDSGEFIVAAQTGDVLTVVNTGTTEMTLDAEGIAPEAVVNAVITITRAF